MGLSHNETGDWEPEFSTSTLKSEPPVASTSRASCPLPSIADRGRASLALIFQPRYEVIQQGLMSKLSSRDLERLCWAASQNLGLLRNLLSPYLAKPQIRCQNNLPLPMLWREMQGSDSHGWTQQAGPRPECGRKLHAENIGVDLAVCDGYRLGLPTGIKHGKYFLVCHHCERLGKSQLRKVWPGTSIKLVGDVRATAELCADCALDRKTLRPHAECRCEREFRKLTLCWDCRVDYPRQWLLDVVCEAAASLPVIDSSVEPAGTTWSTLERWISPPGLGPRSGCLDCGIDYIASACTWFNLWTADEAPGQGSRLAPVITPQAETVCLYCLSPVRRHHHAQRMLGR